jgi:hypothetical protein
MLRHSIEKTRSPFDVRPVGWHTGSFTMLSCATAGDDNNIAITISFLISIFFDKSIYTIGWHWVD